MADPRLRNVALFAAMSDEDIERICAGVTDARLAADEVLFSEGDAGDAAYVVVSGEVDIIKSVGRRTTLLAKRTAGDVIGEMSLLQNEPRTATVRSRTDTELLRIPRQVMEAVLASSPTAMRSVLFTLLDRTQETNTRLRSTERMAQLGTLTAGIAHELNNPAAGAGRAAEELGSSVATLLDAVADMPGVGDRMRALLGAAAALAPAPPLSAMARSDAEAAVEDWLEARGVTHGWELASALVGAGVSVPNLDELTRGLDADEVVAAVRLLACAAVPRRLAADVADASRRISALVSRLKSHAYLDQMPLQDVDINQGIEDSLALLGHKLRDISIVRDYGDVPVIPALGSQLNQVWINLLDNAAEALRGQEGGVVTVRTRVADTDVVAEVEDNGPGIPAEVVDRIFDAFFTTKPPGSGTGLGLNLSYEIVAFDHAGELTVTSQPGRTVFRVALPIQR